VPCRLQLLNTRQRRFRIFRDVDSSNCLHGAGVEHSVEHVVMHCPQFQAPRARLFARMRRTGVEPTFSALMGLVHLQDCPNLRDSVLRAVSMAVQAAAYL